nr:DUF1735 domain-containing protein [Sunxiuqinia sp.]
MKQIKKIAFLALLGLILFSCEIMDMDYSNDTKSSVYFVKQSPIGILSLGDDNDKENNLQLSAPLVVGGMNKNVRDLKVEYVVDESLTQNLYTSTGEALVALPESYYTLPSAGSVIITKGSMQGFIDVQLNDAFFNDPDALKNRYVIPLKLIRSDTDSILQGKAKVENPDPRIADDWDFVPKDYTLFGIKYINKYHGNYLHFGKASVNTQEGIQMEEPVYSASNITDNALLKLSNINKNGVSLSVPVPVSFGSSGNVDLDLNFDNNGAVTVKESEGSPVSVAGTGTFVKDGSELDGKKRNLVTLDYSYTYDYFVEPTVTKINNDEATYNGTWIHNGESGNYKGDRSYANTDGRSLEVDFYGYKISIYHKTGPSYGWYDVYIDDELVATDVSCVTESKAFQVKTFEKTGLTNGPHKLKCVVRSAGKWNIFDFFESEASGDLPNGTYTWDVKDTLVLYDRAIDFETFTPVIK